MVLTPSSRSRSIDIVGLAWDFRRCDVNFWGRLATILRIQASIPVGLHDLAAVLDEAVAAAACDNDSIRKNKESEHLRNQVLVDVVLPAPFGLLNLIVHLGRVVQLLGPRAPVIVEVEAHEPLRVFLASLQVGENLRRDAHQLVTAPELEALFIASQGLLPVHED